MDRDYIHTILFAGGFLVLFGVAEILYHKLKLKVELTRKFVHICTGLITLFFPIFLGNHWLVLVLCLSFSVILIVSLKFNLLKSINAIDRQSVGSLSYPVAVYGSYLAFNYFQQNYIYFYLPILILAICDPIAALTGKRWPKGKYKVGNDNKTLMGSSMFFLSAFVVSMLFISSAFQMHFALLLSFTIAVISTISEAFSRNGLDNITIPASVLGTLIIFHTFFQWI